jgi:hypothetical protein
MAVVVRRTSVSSWSPLNTRKVVSACSTVTVCPAWPIPTWMRCRATLMLPRQLTRRSTPEHTHLRGWEWSGGAGIADAGYLGCGQRVQQRTQHDAVGAEQVQHAVVEASGDPLPGQVVSDRVLPSSQGEQPGGVDGPFDLHCCTRRRRSRTGGDGWLPGWSAAIGQQLMQVSEAQPRRDCLEPDPVQEQVNDAGVGPGLTHRCAKEGLAESLTTGWRRVPRQPKSVSRLVGRRRDHVGRSPHETHI